MPFSIPESARGSLDGLRRSLARTLIVVLATGLAASATGPKPPVNTAGSELAIKGYDAVAYGSGGALKGKPDYTYRWNGAVWQFASAENRTRFSRSPEKYAPQFGGYCAWAVSRGYTADVDPEVFEVVDGKVYLIYSKTVQVRWDQDVPGNIAKAEANWPAVLNK